MSMRGILVMVVATAAFSYAGLAIASTHHRATATVKVALAPGGDPTKLRPSVRTVKTGKVTFLVHNYSNIPHKSFGVPDAPEGHELVVLKTNLAPAGLKVDNLRGVAVETGRVGKPVVLDPGKSGSITLTLPPGKYVLICNLLGHYAAGQYAAFKVVR
jgi:uncharacterized cupredoxin-like copper-binding protein